ncbi:hypothetical protein LIER_39249 [Lithospermum erythrorhizon]|uniref:DUF4283 domain-containing protein n=1 Tax=Lithospermum erythrorhizon TaxID=34254 RepID=A0AAV3QCU4_LITER
MESDLARVLGSLSLEGGGELDDVHVPDVAYDRVEEKFQFSLVAKVLTNRKFHFQTFKDTLKSLCGGSSSLQVLDMGMNVFHVVFNDDVPMIRVLQGKPWLFEGHDILIKR